MIINMFKLIIFILVMGIYAEAAIYRTLNESEYSRLPPLYGLDEYESCLGDPGGVYCLLDLALFSEQPSELMNTLKEYSENTLKHFNRTQAHRGVCVQRSCQPYVNNHTYTTIEGLNKTLEGCLNQSFWDKYQIQAKLAKVQYCNREGDVDSIDVSDAVMVVVYLVLIVLNIVGSFYDILKCKMEEKSGNPYLLSFSVRRNWRRLTAASARGLDPRLDRLKLFNGLRTMTMICVFFSHTSLIMAFSYIDNPQYIEKSYEDPFTQLLFNGSLVTMTFFVMSSFLLAYNLQLHAEKHTITWMAWPKGMLMRWLRLTPVYALMIGTVATWARHGSGGGPGGGAGAPAGGPLRALIVGSETLACRRYWWAHLLYINNYIYDDAYCAPATWYLAADTQLFAAGLLLCVMARSARAQRWSLAAMFLLSLLTPALHTYLQDLDAVVMQSPEAYRSLYGSERTFRLLYVRGHTNLSTYTLGLAGGFLAHAWQTRGVDCTDYRKYRPLYWLVFPAGVALILSGGLFYVDGARPAMIYRVLYAALYKPVFQLLIVIIIISSIFKFENVYRPILEWRGFTWTGRVSYSAFLVHTIVQRYFFGSYTAPAHMSNYFIFTILSATIFISFIVAAVVWMLVEAPIAQLIKAIMAPKRSHFENNMAVATEAGTGDSIQSKL